MSFSVSAPGLRSLSAASSGPQSYLNYQSYASTSGCTGTPTIAFSLGLNTCFLNTGTGISASQQSVMYVQTGSAVIQTYYASTDCTGASSTGLSFTSSGACTGVSGAFSVGSIASSPALKNPGLATVIYATQASCTASNAAPGLVSFVLYAPYTSGSSCFASSTPPVSGSTAPQSFQTTCPSNLVITETYYASNDCSGPSSGQATTNSNLLCGQFKNYGFGSGYSSLTCSPLPTTSSGSASSASSASSLNGGGLNSPGSIAGVTIAVLAFVAAVTGFIIWYLKCYKKQNTDTNTHDGSMTTATIGVPIMGVPTANPLANEAL